MFSFQYKELNQNSILSQKKISPTGSPSLWFSLTIVVEASAIILVLQLAFRPLARSTFYKVWQPRPALVIDCNRSVSLLGTIPSPMSLFLSQWVQGTRGHLTGVTFHFKKIMMAKDRTWPYPRSRVWKRHKSSRRWAIFFCLRLYSGLFAVINQEDRRPTSAAVVYEKSRQSCPRLDDE